MNWLKDLHLYLNIYHYNESQQIGITTTELMVWLKETYLLNNSKELKTKTDFPCYIKLFLNQYCIISNDDYEIDVSATGTDRVLTDIHNECLKLTSLTGLELNRITTYWRKGNFKAIKNHLNKLAEENK